MRITEFQKEAIVSAVRDIDSEAKVWLFGSRADDSRKGGDIDIGILSGKIAAAEEIKIKRVIYDKIGEQKIDIVVSRDGEQAFFKFAVMKGVMLYGP
jgi:predicted nucleotidyltransferase